MWKQSPLSWPSSSQTIQTSAEQVTDQIGITMNDAVNRLINLESDANYGRHSLSEEACALIGLRGDLESLLRAGTVLTATPYQFQVGTKLDSGCYLNPQAAVKVLSGKLRDHADKYRPLPKTEGGNLHCVALMVTASQLVQFANQLADLVSVFPLPDWCQVARQTQALVTKETDKLHQPAAIAQPRFKPMAKLNANPLHDALHWQGAQIATLESLADDASNVICKLQVLAIKRANKLSEVKAQINALKNLKGSVYAFPVTGSAESIATQISQAGAPNNHQFTVVSLLLSHEPMTFFEELLC
ncbi:conserved hypothetical protein [Vibrio crassostreae]|uniref:hypothetical protein n=1 Tax=Vibrio crassostreae TaxID=246167 RepID=UPI000F483FF3|nr:hypothetical protein [Vibrio crassostreae]ROO65740.1 hypothetical protein EDB58_101536 [Vibrio crassostreae]RPF57319.1 hypothetical protein EDB61_105221 [Vibrio crassostreae]CAK3480210.1 conserved hypothetical protein [Vibrio crassostreae]CAK3611048.1 conserved hypothetical protein [Vibrio crassostreae]